jgi:hypothetical protein
MNTDEVYLREAEFIFSSYNPEKLEHGMHFLVKRTRLVPEVEYLYFTLDFDPSNDEAFMGHNGSPVTMNVVSTGNDRELLAEQHEIGIFDDDSGELQPITEDHINIIINKYDGKMGIETDETGDPILYDGKVIISYLASPEEESTNQ